MADRILIVTAVAAEADSVARGLTGGSRGPSGRTPIGPGPAVQPLPGGYALRRHASAILLPGAITPSPLSAHGPLSGTVSAGGLVPPALAQSPEPVPHGPVVDVLVAGVGPAAAAAATSTALARAALGHGPTAGPRTAPYDLVVSAGIAGGFQPDAPLGAIVVSDAIVAADLGAETPDGYLPVEELGFGHSVHRVPDALTGRIAGALADGVQRHVVGPVLTVSTVTGTAERAAELARRHPRAAAEAMEGFGVAEAAAAYGVPVVEIRAVSNPVGPRDRANWRIGQAMDSLRYAFQLLGSTVFVEPMDPIDPRDPRESL
ncbi:MULTISPECIES: futalosine hydrolase [Streptomyces]|uniref:Futalosine hydrolase n=1 Tax=Streptomyces solicathayae TaxID=3081768 RepID=A0ABZ0LVZ5_9ACTN|nr:futalosine hydrolase [Streptomyces sp. HUAS YS2]WOX23667.1 futalosine hydrolase [Streptomyces sp. HUAS YS2]